MVEKELNYLPHFYDHHDNCWDVLEMNWCIDWGGRQCQVNCQLNNNGNTYPQKTFVIYGLTGEFTQWDSDELMNSIPDIDNEFYRHVMSLFKVFDVESVVKEV